MRKLFSTLITALLIVGCLSACGSETGQAKQNDKEPGKLKVVTTIFPEYDWVKNILGDKFDNADVSMLLDSGVDLHSTLKCEDNYNERKIKKNWNRRKPTIRMHNNNNK